MWSVEMKIIGIDIGENNTTADLYDEFGNEFESFQRDRNNY